MQKFEFVSFFHTFFLVSTHWRKEWKGWKKTINKQRTELVIWGPSILDVAGIARTLQKHLTVYCLSHHQMRDFVFGNGWFYKLLQLKSAKGGGKYGWQNNMLYKVCRLLPKTMRWMSQLRRAHQHIIEEELQTLWTERRKIEREWLNCLKEDQWKNMLKHFDHSTIKTFNELYLTRWTVLLIALIIFKLHGCIVI